MLPLALLLPHKIGFSSTLEETMTLKMDTREVNGVTVVSCHGRVMFGEEATALRDNLKQILALNPEGCAQLFRCQLYR